MGFFAEKKEDGSSIVTKEGGKMKRGAADKVVALKIEQVLTCLPGLKIMK